MKFTDRDVKKIHKSEVISALFYYKPKTTYDYRYD